MAWGVIQSLMNRLKDEKRGAFVAQGANVRILNLTHYMAGGACRLLVGFGRFRNHVPGGGDQTKVEVPVDGRASHG